MSGSENKWLSPGNAIALAALCLSLLSVAWQVAAWWWGPQSELIDVEARTVELRCSSSKRQTCWGGENRDEEPPKGRFSVVLPVFLTNTGAPGYDSVVSKAFADVRFKGQNLTLELVANQFWKLVQGGSNSSQPFSPFVVPAGGANGQELRFVAFDEPNFVLWDDIATLIIDGTISGVAIDIRVQLLGEGELKTTCNFVITDRLKAVLASRQASKATARLSSTCRSSP